MQYGLLMGESLVTESSVVSPVAACPTTAKGHAVIGDVHDGVVDATTAKRNIMNNLPNQGFVLSEEVKSQWIAKTSDDRVY